MKYDKEFEEWWKYVGQKRELKEIAFTIWQSARKDYYKIGEEVESQYNGGNWSKAIVGVYLGTIYKDDVNVNVRRVPEWEPKEGEAVFAIDATGKVWAAKVRSIDRDGIYVICSDGDVSMWNRERMKPFSADKIGKPWDEI